MTKKGGAKLMAPHSKKRINISLLIPFLVIVVVFSIMIWQKYRTSQRVPVVPPSQQQQTGKRTVVLFFVADGASLAREARELDVCDDDASCLKDVLDELLTGPVGEFDEALPEGTVISTARIEGDLVTVDLNRTFAEGLPSGSSAEMMAVYSIVNTVTANFPAVQRVKLNIDGDQKAQLGHLDLSDPLPADYSLEQISQSDASKAADPAPSRPNKGTP